MEVVPVTVPRCQTCIWLFSTMTTVVRNPYWGVNPSETFTWEHCRRTRNIIGIVFILRFWELNKRYNWDKRVLSSLVFFGNYFCVVSKVLFCLLLSFCLLSNSIHGVGCHAAQWPTAYWKLPILLPNADFPILRYRVVALLCLIFSTPDLYTHWSGLPLDSNQSEISTRKKIFFARCCAGWGSALIICRTEPAGREASVEKSFFWN